MTYSAPSVAKRRHVMTSVRCATRGPRFPPFQGQIGILCEPSLSIPSPLTIGAETTFDSKGERRRLICLPKTHEWGGDGAGGLKIEVWPPRPLCQ